MCTESTKIQRTGLSNSNFTHKANGQRAKALAKDYGLCEAGVCETAEYRLPQDYLFLVSQLHLRIFLDPGYTILLLVLNTAQRNYDA